MTASPIATIKPPVRALCTCHMCGKHPKNPLFVGCLPFCDRYCLGDLLDKARLLEIEIQDQFYRNMEC